jgi:hypothetical protein
MLGSMPLSAYSAEDCSAFLEEYMDWAALDYYATQVAEYYVGVTVTANYDTRKWTSWSTGILDFFESSGEGIGGVYYHREELVGKITQNFSDSNRQDQATLILQHHADPAKIHVKYVLLSWENAEEEFDAECANGHIYGFGAPDQFGRPMYDITLTKEMFAVR